MSTPGQLRTSLRYIHPLGSGVDNPAVLGGKGASLARMHELGLPTPPGFTIGTDGWRAYREAGERMPDLIRGELAESIAALEGALGRRFGDPDNPLLVSVRSGAPVSMPGMMDTILNLGLSRASVAGLGAATNDEPFAWRLYVRLLTMFATIVRGISHADVDAVARSDEDPHAVADALESLIETSGSPFPQSAADQLGEAVEAVWRSWDSRRARRYRRHAGIDDSLGTAVTVQAMVFGNYDDQSGTGVVFTRDPATGTPTAYGDFLLCAQGEDVVAGGMNTEPLESMRFRLPEAFTELEAALPLIEASYRDMCDVEFTVERGKLWILQARAGQRSGAAAVRIAVDMVEEGLIDIDEALARIPIGAMEQLQAPVFARDQEFDVIGEGTPASPGAAAGAAVFDSTRAQELSDEGTDVVLVRPETSPEDIAGMIAARGIVTAVGGRTSHAAVVARGIGRAAVCGVGGLEVDPAGRRAMFRDRIIEEGDAIALDGATGVVAAGSVRLVPAQPAPRVALVLAWADDRRTVPIEPEAPDTYVRVGSVEEVEAAAAGAPLLVDVDWEGSQSGPLLDRVVLAAVARDCGELALQLPDTLADGDMRPPAAPWKLLVGSSDAWPARLLAARLQVSEQA